jgi:chromosome segregation ATPase
MDPLQQVLERLAEVRADLKELRSEVSSSLADLKATTASHTTWITQHEGQDQAAHERLGREVAELRAGLAAVEKKIAYYVGGAGVVGAIVTFAAPKLAAAL